MAAVAAATGAAALAAAAVAAIIGIGLHTLGRHAAIAAGIAAGVTGKAGEGDAAIGKVIVAVTHDSIPP